MNRHHMHLIMCIAAVCTMLLPGSCAKQERFPVDSSNGQVDPPTPPTEEGTTYYIDATGGDDAADGLTPQTAWESFDNIATLSLTPDDQVLLKRGETFNQRLEIRNALGSKEQPVVIDAYGEGDKPRIVAPDHSTEAVLIYNCTGIHVLNLDIQNTGSDPDMDNRFGLKLQLENFGTAYNTVLKGLDVHDVNGNLLKNNGEGCGIVVFNGGAGKISTFDGLTIEDCTIRRCTRNALKINGYYERSNWHPNLNVVIRGNLIEEVPGDGIVPIGCDGAIVEYNRMCNGTDPWGTMQEAAAGIWPWSCDNTVIQYNEVSDHKAPWDGQGFDADYNCTNTVIKYNYSHDNHGGFLLICDAGPSNYVITNDGAQVYGNVSINDGCRPHSVYKDPSDGARWFSPIVHISGPLTNCTFVNNILHVCERTDARQQKCFIEFGSWNGYSDGVSIRDNLFYSDEDDCNFILSQAKNVSYDGNCYLGLGVGALGTVTDENRSTENETYMSLVGDQSTARENLEKAFLKTVEMPVGPITVVDQEALNQFFNK